MNPIKRVNDYEQTLQNMQIPINDSIVLGQFLNGFQKNLGAGSSEYKPKEINKALNTTVMNFQNDVSVYQKQLQAKL